MTTHKRKVQLSKLEGGEIVLQVDRNLPVVFAPGDLESALQELNAPTDPQPA